MLKKTTIFLAILLICSATEIGASAVEFGLVEPRGEQIYLHSMQTDLKPDSQVQLLKSNVTLYVQRRVDKDSEKASDVMIRTKFATVYLLQAKRAQDLSHKTIPAVIFPAGVSVKPQPNFRYSYCSSNEGVHHSVYATRATGEVRVWSSYQHLLYSVVPSCSKSELAEQ